MRNTVVDALKGYAIILVVIGHAIEELFAAFSENKIYEFIYSFHMPLFMFLSGYIIYGKVREPWGGWIWTKTKRLLIPFFIWFLIWATYRQFDFTRFSFINGLSGLQNYFLNTLFEDPLHTPWFLIVLFMLYCVLLTVNYLKKHIGWSAYIWIFLLLYIQPLRSMWIVLVLWYCPFFFMGYLTAQHRDKLPVITPVVKLLLCGLFIPLILLCPYWSGDYETRMQLLTQWGFHFVIACMGIAASYSLISLLKDKWIIRPLSWLGLYTLDIYVLHMVLISVGIDFYSALLLRNQGFCPSVIFVTLFALLISIGISYAIRRSSTLKAVLFGA